MTCSDAQVKKTIFLHPLPEQYSERGRPLRRVDGAAPFTRFSLQKLHKCGNLSLL